MIRLGVLSFGRETRRPRSGEERIDLRREEALVNRLRGAGYAVLPAGAPFHEEDAIAYEEVDIDRLVGTFHLRPVDIVVVCGHPDVPEGWGDTLGDALGALAKPAVVTQGLSEALLSSLRRALDPRRRGATLPGAADEQDLLTALAALRQPAGGLPEEGGC